MLVRHIDFFACFYAISLERSRFSKIATSFLNPFSTEAIGIVGIIIRITCLMKRGKDLLYILYCVSGQNPYSPVYIPSADKSLVSTLMTTSPLNSPSTTATSTETKPSDSTALNVVLTKPMIVQLPNHGQNNYNTNRSSNSHNYEEVHFNCNSWYRSIEIVQITYV